MNVEAMAGMAAGPPTPHLTPQPPEGHVQERAARFASVASAVLIVGTLLPWLSVTFLTSASLTGIRVAEGRVTIALAFLAGVFAVTALFLNDRRRAALAASGMFGALSLIPIIVFAFRYRDALDLSQLGAGAQVEAIADAGTALESGWYLALAAALALTLISLWGVFSYKAPAAPAEVHSVT